MSRTQRRLLRKGARAAQDKHRARLDKMESRLNVVARHVDDRTMVPLIELCVADVEVLRTWFVSDYEELTSIKVDPPAQGNVLKRLEYLEQQLTTLHTTGVSAATRTNGGLAMDIDKIGWDAEERALKATWPACPHGAVGATNQRSQPTCIQCLADEVIIHPEQFTPDQRLVRLEAARAAIISAPYQEGRHGQERAERLNLLAAASEQAMDAKRHHIAEGT